ncbi:MAG: hypothetical protein O3C40_35730 [Planctomycetota bacterium]|nr:hypothetical protein [Planctomycetota bacterium]
MSVHTTLLAYSSARHNPTIDEAGHMVAGLSHWSFGHFDLYHVNPPLVRMLATLPVMAAGYEERWVADARFTRPEFDLGREFIVINGPRVVWLFTLARWALIPFSLLGAWVCWIWASELYGRVSGNIALCLWCFSPNILAYGQLIVPDMAATAVGLTAWYVFWKWLQVPTSRATIFAAVALGVLQLTKMTWIIVFGLWPIVWLAYRLIPGSVCPSARCLRRELAQLVVMVVAAIGIMNVGYGFEGSFQRLDRFKFQSQALSGNSDSIDIGDPSNRFRGTWLGRVPVPLPENYVLGIDTQRVDFDQKLWSYLRGSYQRGGWWYYYLYALALKVPLGSWCLLGLAIALCVRGNASCGHWRDEVFLLFPAIIIIAFVSSQTGFNHHMRYVLPAFPFLMVFTSSVVKFASVRQRAVRVICAITLTWSMLSTISAYPHNLSYFNELAGGPRNGHFHLLKSNADWGQDVLFLKRWLQQRPNVELSGFAYEYSDVFDPAVVGITVQKPPVDHRWSRIDVVKLAKNNVGPLPGLYAVSVSALHDRHLRYDYL